MSGPSADVPGDSEGNWQSEPTGSTADLPVVDPAAVASASASGEREHGDGDGDGDEHERDGTEPIVGVLLAAGTSSRYGAANKLLVAVEGEPIVRRAAATLCRSAVDRVVTVLGYEAERIGPVLDDIDDFDPVFVENPAYKQGQSTSVRTGVSAASELGAGAVVIALGDMPTVDPTSIDALVDAYRADAGDALAAAFDGRRGNPVLFDRRYFDALGDVSGDVGGREILPNSDRSALVETGDRGVLGDIDTEADLDEYR